ncbi:hypothetical protein CKA32_004189 [Geitlerinema sp. FC II]|nr:hypothetical protein CKA32_004189 [Geitlerinema sp. FC II]
MSDNFTSLDSVVHGYFLTSPDSNGTIERMIQIFTVFQVLFGDKHKI